LPDQVSGTYNPGNQRKPKKQLLLWKTLDNYIKTGIEVSPNVILSPLDRDEAVCKGIKITYLT